MKLKTLGICHLGLSFFSFFLVDFSFVEIQLNFDLLMTEKTMLGDYNT